MVIQHDDSMAPFDVALGESVLAHRLVDIVPDAIVVANSAGAIVFANDQTRRLFGYAPQELMGRSVESLMPERFRAKHIGYRQAYSRHPQIRPMSDRLELIGLHRNGTEFPVDIMISPLEYAGELFTTASIRDGRAGQRLRELNDALLTSSVMQHQLAEEARNAEQSLRESEQRFRMTLRNSAAVAFNQDRDLRYTWIYNPPDEYSDEKLIGKTDGDVMPREAADKLTTIKRHVLETGEHARQVIDVPVGGKTTYWDMTIEPMIDTDGAIIGIAGVAINITDHVRAEQELQLHAGTLQQLLKTSAASLTERDSQLQATEHMAVLGTVAAGLAHDLNNLLFPMRARLDALEQFERVGPVRKGDALEHLAGIRQATDYLAQLCNVVRQLISQGKSVDGETDLRVWWNEVSNLIRSVLPRQIGLEADLPVELPPVKLPRTLMTQLVFNLAHNAGRAMRRQRAGRLRIRAAASADRTSVRIQVSDDGPGMTEEVKRHCLEMSYSTHDTEAASGLGLTLVSSIIKRASGTLEIDSEPGRGTTFTMVLPAVRAEE